MRSDFYVYVLLDPRKPGNYEYGPLKFKHEPFYVGKGKGKRDISHFRPGNLNQDLKRYKNTKRMNKIRKIMEAGFIPLPVRIKSNVIEVTAFKFEVRAIQLIGRGKQGPLVNLTDGGDGISGYVMSAAEKAVKSKWTTAFHAGMSVDEKIVFSAKVRTAILNAMAAMPIEKRLEWAANISKAAANRTPEERELLREKFREVQLSLPARVQKEKNRKVSKGNKAYQARLTVEDKATRSENARNAQNEYWSNADEAERTRRAEAIARGYAKVSKKDLAKKNAKISSKIAEQHAAQTPYQTRMRSFMVMCGVMLKNADKGDDVALKAKLRARGERYYSKAANLENKPSELRDKVRKLIA